jgi:Nickel responsive protein SCO4226-like
MSLFAIERSFSGRRDALFALRRSGRLASEDVLWHRSFLFEEENSALCIWQAPSIETLTKRARTASLPVRHLRRVEEITPGGCGLETFPTSGGQLFCVYRQFLQALTTTELRAGAWRSVRCADTFPGLQWVRSYWDQDNRISFCLYQARRRADLRAHSAVLAVPCNEIWEVTELIPPIHRDPDDPSVPTLSQVPMDKRNPRC